MSEKLISAKYLFSKIDKFILECDGISFEELRKVLKTAPAVDAVEVEKYNDLREAFVDFVCSGIHNPAPWCKNHNNECTNGYGMCVFSNDACRGFNPDGERREEE